MNMFKASYITASDHICLASRNYENEYDGYEKNKLYIFYNKSIFLRIWG